MTVAAFINGIAVGGVAALLAVGISQIFTTSGVLNFAHAGFAMVAAYLYAWLAATEHWPVGWAALATVVIVSLLGTLAEWLVLRRLADAPFITKVIVTLGLYVFMQGATLQLFGFDPKKAPLLFHGGVSIGATVAAYQQLAILGAGLALMAGLALFLRATRLGLATRSCAQDRATAGLIGIPTRAVSSVNWTIGAFMAAVAGVLIAPLAVFTVDSFSIYLVTGIGAALFGGLTGLTGAFLGGLVLGVAQNWAIAESSQPGIWALAIFVAIAALLLLRRRWPWLLAAWAAYIVMLLPVVGIAHNGPQIAADRYTYLPCLPWAILLGGLVSVLWRRAWSIVVAAVAVGCLAWLTVGQIRVWRDAETLWTHALVTAPSAIAHSSLGVALDERGRPEEAIPHFRQALRVNPRLAHAENNWGIALAKQGRWEDAARHYEAALQIDPRYAEAHANLALALGRLGRYADAQRHLEQARAILLSRTR